MSAALSVRREADVCTATLQRPAAGNALSAGLVSALDELLDACQRQPPRLLVLRGEGRHFCTGFDLAQLDQESDDSLLARFTRIELMLQKLHRAPCPTLAVAHGRTVGAGADLFAACTHRVAAPGTQFSFPGAAGFGLVLGTRRLVQRVGAEHARRWVGSGSPVPLEEALACGLATGVLEGAAGADELAASLARQPAAPAANALLAAALHANDPVHDQLDLALLVRSAAEPGLKARIAAYAERARQARG